MSMPRHRKHHGSPWTASDLKKLLALRARGLSGEAIARALGRTRASVYQRLTLRNAKRKRTRR